VKISAALFAFAFTPALLAAEQMTVTVTHDLDLAHPSETVVVPRSQVNAALPGAMLQRIP
jgi:pectinesterase